MAGILNAVYTVLVVVVAVVGTVGTLWVTDTTREETGYATGATALAISLFTLALGASLLA